MGESSKKLSCSCASSHKLKLTLINGQIRKLQAHRVLSELSNNINLITVVYITSDHYNNMVDRLDISEFARLKTLA